MPFYGKKKFARKKTYRKKPRSLRSKRAPTIRANIRSLDYSRPMPPSLSVKMRYVEASKLITTGSAATGYTWSLNNIFDPDVSGVGHQPMGYDQLTVFYNHWRVTGCKYKVTFHSTSADGMKVIVFPRRNAAGYGPVTIEDIQEQPMARNFKVIATDTPTQNGVFKGYMPMYKLFGVTKEKYRIDDVFEGAITAAPSSLASIDCLAQFKDNSTAHTVYVNIELIYYVTFFAPRHLPTS